ncbi:HPr family phosphocarrier protein [Psittacicella gerlachiana]|uniref:Phosphocarrier protein HPr n=1 Tax=Psittacicella gerlachiana TaxID=2028574 RepID=A0A3A1YH29_9GAMM|nr:HPr family phosphocarrier protein [Psittacicella gerlachiana]RIY36766.1 HPr family phosphocarrier protein [Psittacicella gerlachiana]
MTVSKDLTIVAPHGIHMRPATTFAKAAKEFESKVTITAAGETVSAKSPVKIISLNLANGTAITLTCDGPDEEKALEALSALINTLE